MEGGRRHGRAVGDREEREGGDVGGREHDRRPTRLGSALAGPCPASPSLALVGRHMNITQVFFLFSSDVGFIALYDW